MVKQLAKSRLAIFAVALGLVMGSALLTAAPASATAGCTYVNFNQSNGVATGSCSGTSSSSQVHVTVHCSAVWPYTSWTTTHSITIGYGLSFYSKFNSCPWPASYSISTVVS